MKPNALKMIQNQIEDRVRHEVTTELAVKILASMRYVLHNKYDWGEHRIDKFVSHINELLDAVDAEYLDFDDIIKSNCEIYDTKIKRDAKGRFVKKGA